MTIAGLIAAAGLGRRAGGPKAVRIAFEDPRTFLDRSVAAMRSYGCDPVVAVVRPEHKDLALRVGAEVVVPDPAPEAMIDSLRAGLEHLMLRQAVDSVMWAPVDCPRALEFFARSGPRPEDLDGSTPLVAGYQGRPGHPVLLPRSFWGRLEAPEVQEQGARAMLWDALILDLGLECLENRNT